MKRGGLYVTTFSERWFPPKVTQVWTEIHPFERMGLVLEYFDRAEVFSDYATESYRGWPRPEDDMYFRQIQIADPIYAVQARRR